MKSRNSERGSVIVFITLMIVLLLIMVGLGLDTGQLTYSRSQGQAAVDAAALAAVSGLPSADPSDVNQRVVAFNSKNDYVKNTANPIKGTNITYVQYEDATGAINNLAGITNANGVRVALEQNNPYTGAASKTSINTPSFLTPLLNIFGQSAPSSTDINVSAVAVLRAIPSVPIAIKHPICSGPSTISRTLKMDNSCWTTYTDSGATPDRVRNLFDASRVCSGLPANTDRITIDTPIWLNGNTDSTTYVKANELFRVNNPGDCWIVPVISDVSCSASTPTKVTDWAKICPTQVVGLNQNDSERYITVDLTCRQDIFRAEDNLCFSPRLVRDLKSGM